MGEKINAAFQRNDNKRVYFVVGTDVYRFDLENANKLDVGYPKKLKDYWPGLPFETIDAAFKAKHAGKIYFFSGTQYARYDIYSEKVDEGYPKPIRENWNGVPFSSVDSACQRNRVFIEMDKEVYEKVLFFKEDEFLVYDLDSDKMADGYPKKFKEERFRIPFDSIDAIFQRLDHPLFYIFKNDEFLIYDFETRKVVEGYPKKLKGSWEGVF